jgi:hypothetical protein
MQPLISCAILLVKEFTVDKKQGQHTFSNSCGIDYKVKAITNKCKNARIPLVDGNFQNFASFLCFPSL